MHQVWENARVFPPNHVADLVSSTLIYDGLRTRLFLIKDEVLRKQVGAFYKKLVDTAKKTEGKIGTLVILQTQLLNRILLIRRFRLSVLRLGKSGKSLAYRTSYFLL